MEKEDKELLLKDLCARLPYGVIIDYRACDDTKRQTILSASCIPFVQFIGGNGWKDCKPYLRPMSSMTEEEENEICQFMKDYNLLPGANRAGVFCGEIVDWLNAHHFDFRGLIEKGLAIEAPEGVYVAV